MKCDPSKVYCKQRVAMQEYDYEDDYSHYDYPFSWYQYGPRRLGRRKSYMLDGYRYNDILIVPKRNRKSKRYQESTHHETYMKFNELFLCIQ